MRLTLLAACIAVSSLSGLGAADDLVIAEKGRTDYQIVVPNAPPTAEIGDCLRQAARLIQTAFKANGFETPVVSEGNRDPARPGIYLGDTAFARAGGVDLSKIKGWGYVHRVVGRDVIVAGRDQPSPEGTAPQNRRRPPWDRLGTAKAAADFLRQYVGVRFLYPEIPHREPISAAARVDLLASPAIEFLPRPRVAMPAGLNVQKTPVLAYSFSYPPSSSFYDLALNRFPPVDDLFGGHSWWEAVPSEKYRDGHPEYFALLDGKRWKDDDGRPQYCLSNPQVQELIYRYLVEMTDRGYRSVGLGQPDGFRPCQCDPCTKLYGTGGDWSEKLWIFNRTMAERLLKDRPNAQVVMMSYIQTAMPPKSFKAFPANVQVMLTGTNEEDIAPWRGCEAPGGFTGYVYNWCPNLGTRYTPMRTPAFVEAQAKRLYANRIQAIYRDGYGLLFGLEGPVYYTMGRMFDDPPRNQAKDLVAEFCAAAFGKADEPMRSFYEQLYHGVELYSGHLGTRAPAWAYVDIFGRRRKYLTDPFQLIGFLYTPTLLANLDAELARAEKLADAGKARMRLALVRREFDYVRSLARVVHLYHAFQVAPDPHSRARLLDAIDARNAEIASYFDGRGRPRPVPGWAFVMFPPPGHDAKHLRLAYDGYQEPYARTPLNWNVKAMRAGGGEVVFEQDAKK